MTSISRFIQWNSCSLARIGAVGAIVLAASLVTPSTALAHATLVRAEPAVNGRLSACPMRVRLEFNEAIEPTMAAGSILDMHGRRVVLAFSGDPHDVHAVIAPLTCGASGAYRLTWRIVSADGHPVSGMYGFTIGAVDSTSTAALATIAHDSVMLSHETAMMMTQEPDGWGPSVAGAPLALGLLRGFALGALLSLAGLLFFRSGLSAGTAERVDVVARWLAIAAPLLLAAHFLAWVMNTDAMHHLSSESLGVATGTGTGKRELLRIGLALLALWALLLARRTRLALAFSIGAVLVCAAIGHTAAIVPEWAIPGKAVHLVAGAAWVGGVLWLLMLDRTDVALFARETARVSRVAMLCVIAVTLSGVIKLRLFLSSPSDLLHSAYGLLAIAKIAGTLVLIGFGAHHRKRTMPRMGQAWSPHRFASTLRGELAVMAAVVLVGGLLAYVPPTQAVPIPPTPTSEP